MVLEFMEKIFIRYNSLRYNRPFRGGGEMEKTVLPHFFVLKISFFLIFQVGSYQICW